MSYCSAYLQAAVANEAPARDLERVRHLLHVPLVGALQQHVRLHRRQ